MVRVVVGNMFASNAQTWVNTVNCVGVMGKGIALEFRKRFPDMYEDYVQRCRRGQVRLGKPYLFRRLMAPWILNFPTKGHWRSVASLKGILDGLRYVHAHYREWGITSLAVPPLGCGEGQLEWRVVGPMLYSYLNKLDIPVELYAPWGTPPDQLSPAFLAKMEADPFTYTAAPLRVKPAWFALVEALDRVVQEPYHPPVGRVSFHKLAYFASVLGLPVDLQFVRSSYGPFAPDLKKVIADLANNGLIREAQLGTMIAVLPGPTFKEGSKRAYQEYLREWEPVINRLTDLFVRMDTRTAEVAATVHFAATQLRARLRRSPSEMELLQEVTRWKARRKPALRESEVASAIRNLAALGLIDVTPSSDLPLAPIEALAVEPQQVTQSATPDGVPGSPSS